MKVLLFRFCNGFIWIILMTITLQCLFFSGMLNVNNADASPSGGEKPNLEFISWSVGQWNASANSFITDTETYCTLNVCVSYADDQSDIFAPPFCDADDQSNNIAPLTSYSWEIEMTHGFSFENLHWSNGPIGDVYTDFWMIGSGNGDAHGAKGRGGPMSVTIKFKGTYYDAANDLQEVVAEIDIDQDEMDQVRQEYVDHGITVPSRDDFTEGKGEYNKGDYNYYISLNLSQREIDWAAQCEIILRRETGDKTKTITVDDLHVTSAYRNPERNQRVGGSHTSRHQYGDALDVLYVDLNDKDGATKASDALLMIEAARAAGATELIWTPYTDHVHAASWKPK